MPGTYQTRIVSYAGRDRHDGDVALYAYADIFGMIQRELFAAVMSGQSAAGQKNGYVSDVLTKSPRLSPAYPMVAGPLANRNCRPLRPWRLSNGLPMSCGTKRSWST